MALGLSVGWAARADEGLEDVDRLTLAAVMLRDGHFERAEAVLAEIDPAREGLDRPRFFTLRGLGALHRLAWAAARSDFEAAIATGQEDPLVQLYLAQACYGLDDPAGALAALERAWPVAADKLQAHGMRIACRWKLGQRAGAFAALDDAEARFPGTAALAEQRLLYLLELGLLREAAAAGEAYLAAAGGSARAHLTLGEALRQSGQVAEASAVLEAGRLRHPAEGRLVAALARAYHDGGHDLVAARLLEEAAESGQERYRIEAAELYRRAGDRRRALLLNAEVTDQRAKARQRLAILIDDHAFEAAIALESRLGRLGLLDDEDLRYALAYARFQAGDLDEADAHLSRIARADLFRRAAELRRAIEVARRRLGS